jgi:ribosome-associated protein
MTDNFDPSLAPYINAVVAKKASNIVMLDIRELTSVADVFIICTGHSTRQVNAIAQQIKTDLKKENIYPLSMEGEEDGHWVLIDYGHVTIHVFYEIMRSFYDLEGLWIDAERTEIESVV